MLITYIAVDVDLSLPRGSATHTMGVALSLAEQGNEVLVFCRRGNRLQPPRERAGTIYIRRIFRGIFLPLLETHSPAGAGGASPLMRFLSVLYGLYLRTIYLMTCLFFVLRDLRGRRPDMILERGSSLGIGAVLSWLTGAPLVEEVIDPNHSKVSLRKALGVLAYTRRVLKRDVPADQLAIVTAAVDTDLFRARKPRRKLGSLALSDLCVVAYVGVFESWHGLDTIVESARYLGEEGLLFLMVGPGYEKIQEYLEEDLRTMFHFTGPVKREEVPVVLAEADMAIAPFKPTGPQMEDRGYFFSPLKILEYAACGNPVVASDLELIRQVLPEAFFFDPGDAAALAERIRYVWGHRAEAARLAKKAMRRVRSSYTWHSFSSNLICNFRRWQLRRGNPDQSSPTASPPGGGLSDGGL